MQYPVTLHVYDLSQGMARQFSPALMGRQIDGIWHTGIVVYGKEYYYGGGILHDVPFRTPYGTPVQVHNLGTTEISQEMFEDFLNGITARYSMDKYHLLENNCNHFTNECANFLLGKGIPDHISGLPAEVLNTPFGMMIKPMIDQFFSAQGWGAAMGPVSTPFPNIPLFGMPQNSLPTNPSQNPVSVQSPSLNRGTTPTAGTKLHPRHATGHKHTKLTLKNVVHPEPVLFTQADNIPTIFTRLFLFIGEEKERLKLTQEEETNLKLLQASIATQNVKSNIFPVVERLVKQLPPDKVFPALDVLRLLLLNNTANAHFTNVQNPLIIDSLKTHTKSSPRPAQLLAYRVAMNAFSAPSGINYLLHTPDHLYTTIESVVDGLHANDKVMRKTIANLCYNVCLFLDRRHSEEVIQILSALIHLLSGASLSDDPETDARQLLALGTLLYCNDEAVELAQALELDLSKWCASSNAKVKEVAEEIKLMIA